MAFVQPAAAVGPHAAPDAEQLLYAAQHGLVLITRNPHAFTVFQTAWQRWPVAWGLRPVLRHAGILAVRNQPPRPLEPIARAMHAIVLSPPAVGLASRLHLWGTVSGTWFLDWQPRRWPGASP